MSVSEVHYPDCHVQLSGLDGNAFVLMGAVTRTLRRYLRDVMGLSSREAADELDRFREEAMSGDYDHLLQTCMRWVATS